MRVLGIDPGSRWTGFAVVEEPDRKPRLLAHGVAKPKPGDLGVRLAALIETVAEVAEEWSPDVVALERAFVGKSMASALRLGEVRGALLAFAGGRSLPVFDYPPATVKLTVAGAGNADKIVVARAVSGALGEEHAPGDATDAIAVALCHLRQGGFAARVTEAGPRRSRLASIASRVPKGSRFVRVPR